jgi:hypothetical protein
MFTKTDKISETFTARVAAARQLLDAKVVPYAVPAGRKAAKQVRQVVGERIVPVVDNARVASAPVRAEAFRRGRLAAAAMRGGGTIIAKKRRRWPVALVCLGLGGALGAGAAWLAQAGKPVQLTPYPLDDDTDSGLDVHDHEHHSLNGSQPVDLTDESHAHH